MAVAEANAAAASNLKAIVIQMDVGLDTKALTEAWAACQLAQKDLAIMFVTSDAGTLPPHCPTPSCSQSGSYTYVWILMYLLANY